MFMVALQKCQACPNWLFFMVLCKHFWHPSHTKFMVTYFWVTMPNNNVHKTCGKEREISVIVKRWFPQTVYSTLATRSSLTIILASTLLFIMNFGLATFKPNAPFPEWTWTYYVVSVHSAKFRINCCMF